MINMEAVQGAQKIRSGLKEDIANLSDDFVKMESIRFVDFARLWRDQSFSFIFTYKLNENDLRKFIEEAYQIVLDQLNRSETPERAILILYLLYCLYMCQPIEPKVPIKLSLSKYKAFRFLFQESRDNQHLDACYIWMKLLSLGAFHFVAQTKTYGPMTIRSNPVLSSSSNNNPLLHSLRGMESDMEQLESLHRSYLKLKEGLEGPDAAKMRGMNMVGDDLFKEFAKIIERSSEEESSQANKDETNLVPF